MTAAEARAEQAIVALELCQRDLAKAEDRIKRLEAMLDDARKLLKLACDKLQEKGNE